jgi:hypothetical protein
VAMVALVSLVAGVGVLGRRRRCSWSSALAATSTLIEFVEGARSVSSGGGGGGCSVQTGSSFIVFSKGFAVTTLTHEGA